MTDYLDLLLDQTEEEAEEMDWLPSRADAPWKRQAEEFPEAGIAGEQTEFPAGYSRKTGASGMEPDWLDREGSETKSRDQGHGEAREEEWLPGPEGNARLPEHTGDTGGQGEKGRVGLWTAGRPSFATPDGNGPERAEGARWLYQQVARRRTAEGIPIRRETALLSVPQGAEGIERGPLRPESLDRFFKRDARRYDSGFTLY